MVDTKLTKFEEEAIKLIAFSPCQSFYTFGLDEKNDRDNFGDLIPGWIAFRKLEKKGLVFVTEEDLMFPDDPECTDTFTPSIEFTDLGLEIAKNLFSYAFSG